MNNKSSLCVLVAVALTCAPIFCANVKTRLGHYVPRCGATTVFRTITAFSALQCLSVCSMTSTCEVITYDEVGELCQLSANPILASENPSWHVYNFPSGSSCFQNSCYWLTSQKMTYENGKAYCEAAGAHPVTIETVEKFDFITTQLFTQTAFADQFGPDIEKDSLYIGATDLDETSIYKWLDGTPLGDGFQMWAPTSGDSDAEHCVVMWVGDDWQWSDVFCNLTLSVFCEVELK